MGDKEHYLANKKGGSHPSLLGPIEDVFTDFTVPRIPKFIETYHLTLTTLLWSALIVFFGYFSTTNPLYLLGIPVMIILQWTTDLADGAVGRHRDTGLVRWGFYADHFLDYIFLVSVLVGFHFYFTSFVEYNPIYLLIIGICAVGFFLNSMLVGAANKEVKIDFMKIGPSEMRFLGIVLIILFYFINTPMVLLPLPYIAILGSLGLLISFTLSGKNLWNIDMKVKWQALSQSPFQ